MNAPSQLLLKWLEQAYTMEKESEGLLGTLEGHLADHPLLQERITAHREQTAWQLGEVEDCVHLAGGTVPLIESAATATAFNLHSSISFAIDADLTRALALTHAFKQ
jgi:ferritin-like metal-binding protein YciE